MLELGVSAIMKRVDGILIAREAGSFLAQVYDPLIDLDIDRKRL